MGFEAGRDEGGVFRHLSEEPIDRAGRRGLAIFLGNYVYIEAGRNAAQDDAQDAGRAAGLEAVRLETGRLEAVRLEAIRADVPPPWTLATFQEVHRKLLAGSRPDIAGKLRDERTAAGETLVGYANDAMAYAREADKTPEIIEETFMRAARFYASAVTAQLFERGNEYWARTMVDFLIRECGFPPGTLFEIDRTELDFQVFIVSLLDNPWPLAETLLQGFLEKRRLYRDAPLDEEQRRAPQQP